MADNLIVIGDSVFLKKYFHSMGLTTQEQEGENGQSETVHVLRVNLIEGPGFAVGGTREEVEAGFQYVLQQLKPGINISRGVPGKEKENGEDENG